MSLGRRFPVALGVAAVALITASGAAVAEIPADVEARIRAVADDYRARADLRRRMASAPSDPVLSRVMAENDRRIGEARMASVVIATIISRPALADELIAEVSARAPALDAGVRMQVSLAFPFRAARPAAPPRLAIASPAPRTAAPPSSSSSSPPSSSPRSPATFGAAEIDDEEEEEAAAAAAELAEGDIAPARDDPLEGFNRAVFWVNDTLDRWIFRPIAWTYGKLMPEPGKRGLRNVVRNLKGPIILVNDLLQLEFADASITTARLVANTTLGLGGLFDVAASLGLKHHPADFGQTLHAYGVASGPYIVLPFVGPSTVRDGAGQVIDTFFDPLIYILEPSENLIKVGARTLIDRERVLSQTDALEKSSLDYYAAVRSLYLQDRAIELERAKPDDSVRAEPWATAPDWLDRDG